MTCRTCHFLDVKTDKRGRVIPRKDHGYICTVEIPKPDLPACMTAGWQGIKWPPHKIWMLPDMGEGCPCWKKRRTVT